jgi:hypothetical protein
LKAVLDVSLRVLPHAYRDVVAREGAAVTFEVTGSAGGMWTLKRDDDRWTLWSGRPDRIDARVTVSDDVAWRLLYNGLPAAEIPEQIAVEGSSDLAVPFFRARSIVI